MKQLLPLLPLLFLSLVSPAQCPPGSVTPHNQAQVYAIGVNYSTCTEIAGNLTTVGGSTTLNNTNVTHPTELSDLENMPGSI